MQRVILTRPKYRSTPFQRKSSEGEGVALARKSARKSQTNDSNPHPTTPSIEGGGGGVGFVGVESRKDTALEMLNSLPEAQQRQILDALALKLNTEQETEAGRELTLWGAAVAEALERETRSSVGALLARRQLSTRSAWKPVADVLVAAGGNRLTVAERQALLTFLARVLVKHAVTVSARSGAPLSLKLVTNCTGNLPGLVDQEFPGYAAAGLLPIVARRLVNAGGMHAR